MLHTNIKYVNILYMIIKYIIQNLFTMVFYNVPMAACR